jgi:hypothetical protein
MADSGTWLSERGRLNIRFPAPFSVARKVFGPDAGRMSDTSGIRLQLLFNVTWPKTTFESNVDVHVLLADPADDTGAAVLAVDVAATPGIRAESLVPVTEPEDRSAAQATPDPDPVAGEVPHVAGLSR